MNEVRYKFYHSVAGSEDEPTEVKPNYKDDLSITYERDSDTQFFRAKLDGKLTFYRYDYDLVMSDDYDFDTQHIISIKKSNDFGITYEDYHTFSFYLTDCTVNEFNKTIEVQPDVYDNYNSVLDGMEKTYNLIPLAPNMDAVTLHKRPILQLYCKGEQKLDNYILGLTWETEITADPTSLREEYLYDCHFELDTIVKQIKIDAIEGGLSGANGVYAGKLTYTFEEDIDEDKILWRGNLFPVDSTHSYYIYVEQQLHNNIERSTALVQLKIGSSILYEYRKTGESSFDYEQFVMNAVGGAGVSGRMQASMYSYNVYSRLLVDNPDFTYEDYDGRQRPTTKHAKKLPTDDIVVADNRNFHYAIDIRINGEGGIAAPSLVLSDDATEWGKVSEWAAKDGKCYDKPGEESDNIKYYPLARSKWTKTSVWCVYNFSNWYAVEYSGASQPFQLRDAYELASCISVLLKEITGGTITHANTTDYSEFLYGGTNPVTNDYWKLYLTQKTNIKRGEYTVPAQKAETSLKEILDMLKNVFRCYWWIDAENRLRIEHISYFRNGGSYTQEQRGTWINTTLMQNSRNGKAWSYGQTEYAFEKEQMPQRYEFGWMDNCTLPFRGNAIEVLSGYVKKGKVEEINVSNFTSDIDYVLMNPNDISDDGFIIMAVNENKEVEVNDWWYEYGVVLQNGFLAFMDLQPKYWVYDLPAKSVMINGSTITASGIKRTKTQKMSVPTMNMDEQPDKNVITELGIGEIQKLSVNLLTREATLDLKYEPE